MEDIDPELVKELRKDPSLFVEKVLGKEPHSYQDEILSNPHDRICITGGRQIGKTTMMAWLALHEFVMFSDRKILLVAPTKRQAKNFATKLKNEIAEWTRNPDQYGLEYVAKMRLEGANGSWIQAVPALEETIRGLTINSVYVDESAFIGRKIFTSVLSPMMATTEGQFVIASTAWGKDGYLYSKFEEDEHWDEYRISSMENPDIPSRQIEEWRREMTDMEFQREVLGQFSDKKNAFFKNRDVNKCLQWTKDIPDSENVVYPDRNGRDAYLGVDPATEGDDQAVLTSIDETGNVFAVKAIDKCEIPELEGEIRNLLQSRDRNYIEARIEENGLGEGTVHRFEDMFREVEGFRATLRSKESIYQELKNKMQSEEINIPDREDLKSQLRIIEYEMTERGNKKIFAPGRNHDDMADSLALAVASWTGKEYVDRQPRAYSFNDDFEVEDERAKDKRAYTF